MKTAVSPLGATVEIATRRSERVGTVSAGVGGQAAADGAGDSGCPFEAGESGASGRAGEGGEAGARVDLEGGLADLAAGFGLVLEHDAAQAAVANQHVGTRAEDSERGLGAMGGPDGFDQRVSVADDDEPVGGSADLDEGVSAERFAAERAQFLQQYLEHLRAGHDAPPDFESDCESSWERMTGPAASISPAPMVMIRSPGWALAAASAALCSTEPA